MANALSGPAQNLPVTNALQQNNNTQSAADQAREAVEQEEGLQSSTLRTEEQQATTETTEFRTDANDDTQLAATDTNAAPTVTASGDERGSNVDILV